MSVDGPSAGRSAILFPPHGQRLHLPMGLVVALPEEARALARVIDNPRRWSQGECRLLEGSCGGSPVAMAWAEYRSGAGDGGEGGLAVDPLAAAQPPVAQEA